MCDEFIRGVLQVLKLVKSNFGQKSYPFKDSFVRIVFVRDSHIGIISLMLL